MHRRCAGWSSRWIGRASRNPGRWPTTSARSPPISTRPTTTGWEDAEELRLEAIEILARLPNARQAHEAAVADLAMHHIRREYGRDFAEQATGFFDLVADQPDADARAGELVADACRLGDFVHFPALALDFAAVANAYLARFSAGDDETVVCAARALSILLDEARRSRACRPLGRAGASCRSPDGRRRGGDARTDLRARIVLVIGRPDDAVAVADLANQRMAAAYSGRRSAAGR